MKKKEDFSVFTVRLFRRSLITLLWQRSGKELGSSYWKEVQKAEEHLFERKTKAWFFGFP